jgi:hypothetical protein
LRTAWRHAFDAVAGVVVGVDGGVQVVAVAEGRVHVPGGGRNRRGRIEDARPRQLAGGDGVAQGQHHAVAVAEVAHRGEAGVQRLPRVHRGVVGHRRRRQGHRLHLRLHAGRVGSEMHVAVDQPGQHETRTQVDYASIVRHHIEFRRCAVAVDHAVHQTIADHQRAGPARRLAGFVEQAAGLHHDPGFRAGRCSKNQGDDGGKGVLAHGVSRWAKP